MNDDNRPAEKTSHGWWTRENGMALVLFLATLFAIYLCYLITVPFLPALAWALALAVLGAPLHRQIERRIRFPAVAATVTISIVALTLVAPTIFLIQAMVGEVSVNLDRLQEGVKSGEWERALEKNPRVEGVMDWIEARLDLEKKLEDTASRFADWGSLVVRKSAWIGMQLLITFFLLFYFFRDRKRALHSILSLAPLSPREATRMFRRVADTIYATIYGTLVVSAVQGLLGGVIFWALGLPGPIFWGVIMTLLAIVPILGPFVVWIPAVIYLLVQGSFWKAAILLVWGGVVIALIDNLLYPILVGKKLRLHTVPVFIAIIGGLLVFGPSGLILGPVILAVTAGLLEVWRVRTEDGHAAEEAAT